MIVFLAACGPQATTPAGPAGPTIEAPDDASRLAAASPVALAAAGEAVYYADLEGVWAVPVAGGDARLIAAPPQLVEQLVTHGDELVLGTSAGVLAVSAAGGPVRTVHAGAATWFAIDADGVWLVDEAGLRVVPLAGGEARTVAAGLGEVVAPVVTDGEAVYAALALDETVTVGRREEVQAAAIVRIAKRDGARTMLAKRQFGVAGLVRRDDRLYWTSFGAGLRSVPTRGGAIATHLGGGGVALAADADGVVVQTTSGMWIEVRSEGARVAAGTFGRLPERTPGLVLAGGAIVALVTDHDQGHSELWREVRPWRSSITVAGWVTDGLRELAATDDGVIALDAPRDEEATGRLLRIDGRGRRRVVASATGMSELAVDGDQVAYRAGDAIWRVRGAAAPARAVTVGEELVLGLVLTGDTFYWSDSQGVRTATAGGSPRTFFDDPETGYGGSGRPDANLLVDGKTVYFSQLGWGGDGIQRVVDTTTAQLLYEPPGEAWTEAALVRVGDALFFTTSEPAIVRLPLAGGGARVVARGGQYPFGELATGGGNLVTESYSDAGQVLAHVDAAAGKVTPIVTFATESMLHLAVAPAGDAVYVGLVDSDLIVRVPLPPARTRP